MNCFSRKIVKHFTNKIDLRSFQKKVSQEELRKYLDPYGFLKEDEWKQYLIDSAKNSDKNGTEDTNNQSDNVVKTESTNENNSINTSNTSYKNVSNIAPEYGFKVKGPEPTRFGDWERKGRCTDFE